MTNKLSDNQLADRLKKGDKNSCSMLYERYVRPIYRFALIKTSNPQTAEDLTQDVFIRMIDRIQTFRGANFKSWLYTIARNIIADYWRDAYKSPTIPLEDWLGFSEDKPDILLDEDPHANEKQKEILTSNILDQLPDNYRTVLELRFLKDYTLKEAAAEMNISLSNAKVMQHRAVKKASEYRLKNRE